MLCEHESYDEVEDIYGKVYLVCETCREEIPQEDTRSFYIDEDTGKVTW